jgi:hypothetical protein
MAIDDIIVFSDIIITVGDTFQIPPLKHYGEELLCQTRMFDIITMQRLLVQFPEIVEIICGPKDMKAVVQFYSS